MLCSRGCLGSRAGHHPGLQKLQGPDCGRPLQSEAQCHRWVHGHQDESLLLLCCIVLSKMEYVLWMTAPYKYNFLPEQHCCAKYFSRWWPVCLSTLCFPPPVTVGRNGSGKSNFFYGTSPSMNLTMQQSQHVSLLCDASYLWLYKAVFSALLL